MADETPKQFDLQSQPAILSPPLTPRGKKLSRSEEPDAVVDPVQPPHRPAGEGDYRPLGSAASRGSQPAPDYDPGQADADEVANLGANLARALQAGGYHPVILFGTNFSGKTSLLLSLFSTLMSEPRLETGMVLCDPVLGSGSGIGRKLHDEAVRLFDVGTQAFIAGEPTPKTNVALPFFVPVEVRPAGKPVQRFAFLESNGEWYRPLRGKNQRLSELERLFPGLRSETETFIRNFQGGISFIYLTPFTQRFAYADQDSVHDADEISSASLAISGVLRAYDSIRANHRASDRHLMLVTKWDAQSARATDRAEGIQEDRAALSEFCTLNYGQALTAFQGLNVDPHQRQLNAYCSGIINEHGLLQLKHGDDVRTVVMNYPIRLWNWLYQNGLQAAGEAPVPLFPEPPRPPAVVRLWNRLLDFASGR